MSNSNNLPKLEYEDINSGYGTLNKDISKKFDNRKGILFEKNNILFGKLRPYLKKWYLSNFKGIALGDFWVLKTKGTNVNFVYYLIQSSSYQKVANNTSGTKMPRSDWKSVSQSPFYIPSIPEQSRVGNILKDVDLSITLQQRQLDLYKKLKKGLLQKLFLKMGKEYLR
ncbi:restriction endonuclease subunit S [Companilactobacillus kimchii]|uniref:restriction endonuclease subunit S n=1 Tax=Companilactobacillus kimchii TaxID=2801452 RepID=UPI0006CFD956